MKQTDRSKFVSFPSSGKRTVIFPPCRASGSLLEAIPAAAEFRFGIGSGEGVLLSPARSGFDQFRNDQQRGPLFCSVVKSTRGGAPAGDPNRQREMRSRLKPMKADRVRQNLIRGFVREAWEQQRT